MNPSPEPGPLLIAEDDPFDLALLKNALSLLGIEHPILSFASGIELLRFLDPAPVARIARPNPALLLLDLKMPGIDGYGVIAAIRQNSRLARLPIVVITGLEAPEELNRALDLGADECVSSIVTCRRSDVDLVLSPSNGK
jgi:CheY-like chemotaxis protein